MPYNEFAIRRHAARRMNTRPIVIGLSLLLNAEALSQTTPEAFHFETWSAKLQATYVWQKKPAFDAAYTGPNSLVPEGEVGYTMTSTLFLGVRPWAGGELWLNPETIQSQEFSNLTGLGGLSNGENQKGGGPTPRFYRARLFLRQTIDLGGEASKIDSGPNALAGATTSRRLVVTAGNFAVMDVFDNNSLSHDPRTQFFNWALMTYGAYDYAADSRGYTWGLAVEHYLDEWAFRAGRFAQPKESNGLPLDSRIFLHYGDQVEVEHAHEIGGQRGKVRVLGFRNVADMGSFRDALDHASVHGGTPAVADVRKNQSKTGLGVALDQSVSKDIGVFLRASWADGQTETYAFAEIDRSLQGGIVVKGRAWRRPDDALGAAAVVNGLSSAHADYLAAGGLGFFLGDGRITYGPETILEAYYSLAAFKGAGLTLDYQKITNPAYNRDRGPVQIYGFRAHFEF